MTPDELASAAASNDHISKIECHDDDLALQIFLGYISICFFAGANVAYLSTTDRLVKMEKLVSVVTKPEFFEYKRQNIMKHKSGSVLILATYCMELNSFRGSVILDKVNDFDNCYDVGVCCSYVQGDDLLIRV
jgi:hypothetical protein